MQLTETQAAQELLVAHLLRCKKVINQVANALRPEDFTARERHLQIIWSISRDWYAEHRTPIQVEYLGLELAKRLKDDPDFMMPHEVESTQLLIAHAYAISEDLLNPDYMIPKLQELIDERRVGSMIQDAALNSDALDARLESLMGVYSATRLTTASKVDLFSAESKAERMAIKSPFGIPFIDALLDGGIAVGEVYGLLGVSGLGKSILGQQLAIEMARNKRHVAILHYEMDVKPTVAKRIAGYLGDVPKDELSSCPSIDSLPAKYLERMAKHEQEFANEYLHVFDMKSTKSGGSQGMDDVRAILQQSHDEGNHIDFVVIDQLLPMVKRKLSASGGGIDPGQQRMVMSGIVDEAIVLASENQMATSIMLIHQSVAEVKKRQAVQKPRQGESLENRSFDDWLSYCLALGTQDDNRCAWCVATKARGASRGSFIVQLNEHFPRFDYEKNKWRAERQGFVLNSDSANFGQTAGYSAETSIDV